MAYRGKDKKQPYKPATKVKPPARGRGYGGVPKPEETPQYTSFTGQQPVYPYTSFTGQQRLAPPPTIPLSYAEAVRRATIPAQRWVDPFTGRVEEVPPTFQGYPLAPAVTPGNPASAQYLWNKLPTANARGYHGRVAPQPVKKPIDINARHGYKQQVELAKLKPGETTGVLPWNPGTYPEQEYAGGGGYGGYGGYGGGGGYEYTPTQYPFKEYQQGYAMQGVPAPAAPTMRTAAQAQPYRGYATQNEGQRWIQYLINWRV